MLRQVSPDGDVGEMDSAPTNDVRRSFSRSARSLDRDSDDAKNGLRALVGGGRPEDLSSDQAIGLEAIVLPRYRPVVDIINNDFHAPQKPWTHLGSKRVREQLLRVIPSIGRVEVPDHPKLPYAGTGFVVGNGIMMTNRHVAEVFATGLGRKQLGFQGGQSASLDFRREVIPTEPVLLDVEDVLMIHPQFDMALLKVRGMGDHHPALTLDVAEPRDLRENDVVVIGYPAQDRRNDQELQNQVFRGIFDVKRIQPGKLKATERLRDYYGNEVDTVTHDCSTLGGNSGSAVIDIETGSVVALHFAGKYLKANYAIPARELARDTRVVATEINFNESVPASSAWESKWRLADQEPRRDLPSVNSMNVPVAQRSSWNLPIEVEVSIGDQTVISKSVVQVPALPDESTPRQIPKVHDGLEERSGYQADFLDDGNEGRKIEIPALTLRGRRCAARLDDESFILKYHQFSVIMHKVRRLAILSAANVDYRPERRKVDEQKPSHKQLSEIPGRFDVQWITDPRIPHIYQFPDVFVSNENIAVHQNHLVRRADVCWGSSFEDMQKAYGDTFHTTNCSPYVSALDETLRDDWAQLDDALQQQTSAQKALIFSGPVFDDEDPLFNGRDKHGSFTIRVPQSYWRVVVVPSEQRLAAYGFVLQHASKAANDPQLTVREQWQRHQKPIHEIQRLTNRLFDMRELIDIDSLGD